MGIVPTDEASTVWKNEAATQKEVDQAVTQLEKAMKALAEKPQMNFEDVAESDWFYKEVEYCYQRGIMKGLEEGGVVFAPYTTLSRAQFAVIVHRMAGEPGVEYHGEFPDVQDGQWYTDAIAWANSIGVVTGYTHNKLFGLADEIIISRFMQAYNQ